MDSAINTVMGKRFGKRQQMTCSLHGGRRGAFAGNPSCPERMSALRALDVPALPCVELALVVERGLGIFRRHQVLQRLTVEPRQLQVEIRRL